MPSSPCHLLYPRCGCPAPAGTPKKRTAGQPRSPWRVRKEAEARELSGIELRIIQAIEAGLGDAVLTATEIALARVSFSKFCQLAWPVIEPSTHLEWGRHHELICSTLQALFEDWWRSKQERGYIPLVRNTVFNCPPGSLKPCDVEGLVLEERRGYVRLGDVTVGDRVLTHRGRYRDVLTIADQGFLPLLQFTTTRGRQIKVAGDHPMLTQRGWLRADQITTYDVLAAVHAVERCGSELATLEECRLLGYLIGDGCMQNNGASFTNQDTETVADFIACAEAQGLDTSVTERPAKYKLSAARGTHIIGLKTRSTPKRTNSDVRLWLERHNLIGKNSRTKRVPAVVMGGTDEIIAEYLAAYWACDGGIQDRRDLPRSGRINQMTRTVRIDAVTVSEGLARDHQALLQRLGLEFSLRRHTTKLTAAMCGASGERIGQDYVTWQLCACDQDTSAKFMEVVGPRIRHEKRSRAPGLVRNNFDHVLHPDRVVLIESVPPGKCRCLQVDEDSSFVYQGVAVHNSKLIAVFFHAWVWIRAPGTKFVCVSVNESAAQRDARDTRSLLLSDWYQLNFQPSWTLKTDQDAISDFGNTDGGGRLSRASGSVIVGLRGDFFLGDDLNDPEESDKQSERDKVNSLWDTNQYNRVNDPLRSQRICVQQRVHANDHTGHIISKQGLWSLDNRNGWLLVVLPAEMELSRPPFTLPDGLQPYITELPDNEIRDWRTEAGEPLHPARMPADWLEGEKKRWAGTSNYAGQMQQRPTAEGGGKIKRVWFNWFKLAKGVRPGIDEADSGRLRPHDCSKGDAVVIHAAHHKPGFWDFDQVVLSVDPAYKKTEKGSLWGMLAFGCKGARKYLLDDRSQRGEPDEAIEIMKQLVRTWLPDKILIEDKAGGAGMHRTLELAMGEGDVPMVELELVNPGTLDKDARVNAAIPSLANGMLYLLDGAPWLEEYVEELALYPNGMRNDRIDATTQAITHIRIDDCAYPSASAWKAALA